MRRPGLWVANGTPTNSEQMLSWRPGALTCFYDYLVPNRVAEYKARQPEALIVVRFPHPRRWRDDPTGTAQNLGRYVASRWPEIRGLDPYVYFGNEMNLHYESGDGDPNHQFLFETEAFYEQYAAWVRQIAEVIKNEAPDMKLVTPPFAFGHGEDGAPDDNGQPTAGWAGYDYLAETIRDYFDNIITFHSYWGHAGGSERDWLYDPVLSTWYAHRWQRLIKLFKTRYQMPVRVIIDEAGNFSASDADFSQQIIDHATTCLTDPRVLAVTYFLWEDPTLSPGNLPNSWTQRVLNLDDHLARLAALPDFPLEEERLEEREDEAAAGPTIRVLFPDGRVETMLLEEYLRAVVPAEVPALWPAEAVKAQAVAARTYAQSAIERPRHADQGADICTSPAHCQNYDPSRIHPASDEAILATDGLIMRYEGKTIEAVFSANCGGHTLNNEDVFRGAPRPYLRGVPCPAPGPKHGHGVGLCQHGARAFAGQGQTYDAILGHYYQGINLVSVSAPRTGVIRGFVLDLLDTPIPDVRVSLSANGVTGPLEARSAADGGFGFQDLSPGQYRLSLPDFELERSGLQLAAGQDLVVRFTVEQASPQGYTMKVERFSGGLPLLVGNIVDQPGVEITITDPWGNASRVLSGSKPEYGPGGFELYAPHHGDYGLQFLGERFTVTLDGRFTQVTFARRETAGPAQSVVSGVLRDDAGQPVSGRALTLSDGATARQATTDPAGAFRFENLAAGTYTLAVTGTALEQAVTVDGASAQTVDLRLPPPAGDGWEMEVERGQGLPLLVGDIGQPGQAILITDPQGFQAQVTSGSKPEFGPGGFEVYAPRTGQYTVQFLSETFTVTMDGRFTRLTFRRGAPSSGNTVRLVSTSLSRARAQAILAALEADPGTAGLFVLEEG